MRRPPRHARPIPPPSVPPDAPPHAATPDDRPVDDAVVDELPTTVLDAAILRLLVAHERTEAPPAPETLDDARGTERGDGADASHDG